MNYPCQILPSPRNAKSLFQPTSPGRSFQFFVGCLDEQDQTRDPHQTPSRQHHHLHHVSKVHLSRRARRIASVMALVMALKGTGGLSFSGFARFQSIWPCLRNSDSSNERSFEYASEFAPPKGSSTIATFLLTMRNCSRPFKSWPASSTAKSAVPYLPSLLSRMILITRSSKSPEDSMSAGLFAKD